MNVFRHLRHTALVLAVVSAAALTTAGTATAEDLAVAAAPGCGWRADAAQLAAAVENSTDPRAVSIRAQLAALGITAHSAPCSAPPAPPVGDNPPTGAHPADDAVAQAPFSGPPADAVQTCDKFGRVDVDAGRFFVQNDQWGEDSPQCIDAWDTGFTVTSADHHSSGGVPAAYPSLVAGCHYGGCTTGTQMPRPVRGISQMTSSWNTVVPSDGEWNVAYDIWFDPTARRDGTATGLELMIWLDKQGPQTPLGSLQTTTTIGGVEWEVWTGDNGTPVLSYVRKDPVTTVTDLDLAAFYRDAQQRNMIDPSWFLTSVQAGFEPVVGGQGLTTTSFSLSEGGNINVGPMMHRP